MRLSPDEIAEMQENLKPLLDEMLDAQERRQRAWRLASIAAEFVGRVCPYGAVNDTHQAIRLAVELAIELEAAVKQRLREPGA